MLKIKEIRNRKRMTLDELAEKSGVSKRMISAYEANQNDITYTKLKMLADALGVHVLELTGEYDEPTPTVKDVDVQILGDKSTEKEEKIQMLLEMSSLYKKQIQVLEKHNESLLSNTQMLEEKVLDLSAKLTHYENMTRDTSRSA
jgi:transcriptional regulator with XRE-family HTH domain